MRLAPSLRRLLCLCHLYRRKTMFGTARVYETTWQGDRIRVLDVNGSYQSATYLDEDWALPPFPYLRLYDCIFEDARPARDLCMLGGGGYAYPKHVVAHHAPARIDVVEIDPTMTRIARDLFFLDRALDRYQAEKTGRLHIVHDDALSHLRACVQQGRRYDALLNDCFMAGNPDTALASPDALELVHACLRPRGAYLVNVISALEGSDAEPLLSLVASLGDVFDHIRALPCNRVEPEQKDNIVVVASDANLNLAQGLRLFDAYPDRTTSS